MSLKIPIMVECDECETYRYISINADVVMLKVPKTSTENTTTSNFNVKRFLILEEKIDTDVLPSGWMILQTDAGTKYLCSGCKEYLANKEEKEIS